MLAKPFVRLIGREAYFSEASRNALNMLSLAAFGQYSRQSRHVGSPKWATIIHRALMAASARGA